MSCMIWSSNIDSKLNQGVISIWMYSLASIGHHIMKMKKGHDCHIFIMWLLCLERWSLYWNAPCFIQRFSDWNNLIILNSGNVAWFLSWWFMTSMMCWMWFIISGQMELLLQVASFASLGPLMNDLWTHREKHGTWNLLRKNRECNCC